MPRTAAQWAEIRTATRARILEGALDAFKAKGVHGASMNLIARRARASKGLAYNYFASKKDLVAAVIEEWLEELSTMWDGVELEPDPVKGIEVVLDRFCKSVERGPERYRLYFEVFFERGYLAPIHAAGRHSRKLVQQIERIHSASRHLFRRLGTPDVEAEVLFFRLLTSGLAAEFIMSPGRFRMRHMRARIATYYRSVFSCQQMAQVKR